MELILVAIVIFATFKIIKAQKYKKLESEVLSELGFLNWKMISYIDEIITVKSRQTLQKYDDIKFFKEDRERLIHAELIIKRKNEVDKILRDFLSNNKFKDRYQYSRITEQINTILWSASAYRISVNYISSAGNHLGEKTIAITQYDINRFKKDPSLLMNKSEYNKYIKEQQKEALDQKHHKFYGSVNEIINYANENRADLVIKDSQKQLDNLIAQLFDRTVNSIKKIKIF